MGANPTQALGVLTFLLAFVLIAAGMFMGGSVILIVAGLAVLGGSCAAFAKCKPWEHQED